MKPIQTAGVIGLGSLGVLYATLFTRALGKEQVPVLADGARIARYRKQGFWYNDAPCNFTTPMPPLAQSRWTYSLFAVKFGGLQNAIETCRHLVGPDTLVISVLNGISSEEILGDAFGPEHVVWCVAERMAAKKEGNRVVCDPIGELAGRPRREDTSRLQRLTAFFDSIGFPYVVPADIRTHMWSKLLCNTGCNQAALVFQCDYGPLQVPGKPRDTMIGAMGGGRRGHAEGVPLSEKDVAAWVDIIDHLPSNGETSMRQDGKNHRKSEVELFAGTIRRLAAKHGISSLSTTGCTSRSRRWSGTTEPVRQRDKCRSSVLHSMISSRCLRTGTLESPGTKVPGHLLFPYQPQPVQPVGAPQVPDSTQENLHHRGGRVASPRWNRELSAARLTSSATGSRTPGPRPFLAP
ncbi:MAG: ketopantoate reductase family protein [Dysosmobacter welbionis]